ncbi:MAG: YdbL family protein [Nitrospirae bacterium]|nr:YdbL family protein [Nitrospirota bacterium]
MIMRRYALKKSPLYFLVFFITSCVTINIYFPAAAVEKAADRIVDEVWGEKGQTPEKQEQQEQQKTPDGPQSLLRNSMTFTLSIVGPGEAYAQEADINITTPGIRTLKDSIQRRADSIRPYMDKGNAGISNNGLLLVRSTDGLNLKDKASFTRLIEAENKDREALYREIAAANNFPPEKVPDIKKIFAGSWIKNAKKGWWVQDAGGEWRQK